ncbi:hypothetical protein VTK73DRAFT_8183 [Phialemonium thermophilum]|uniref:RING-type E3 ubiquitin transferase n=1 Tax=Phialemonium thermophilum TaxID=223376 RepID=A0ABR3XPY5_9PEZI
MKMRLAWYAGASTALAAAVIASALYQRPNFYSAMVHLAQSSLSLMILVNFIFLIYGTFMYGLQRLCFGQLRPVEVEQLYEKAWFAVTETCLAMTIFRDEVGAFFLVMFTALVTGKVWGWIGEGRVEVLEQQPPANPRLFHTRLIVSLLSSVIYDIWLLRYTVSTVVQQAKPTMMVMFFFEFAILTISSLQTTVRYAITLIEARIVKAQTARRLEERRRQIRQERDEILARRAAEGEGEGGTQEPLPSEEDIDEMDIEVPGWEAKGQWILGLDLLSDMLKLGIYSGFFCVLFTFYGLPIHIMRDLFLTTRSVVKKLSALLRYRQAVRDMNKYPDASAEELAREDTCIICREEMRPWDPANPGQVERYRPKKLPCGHILHFGCLKSWLERQQVCPTCRSPVVVDHPPARNGEAMVFRLGLDFPNAQNPQPPADRAGRGVDQAGRGGQNQQQNDQRNNGVRLFNLGPLRLGFAQGGAQEIQQMAQRLGMPADVANTPQAAAATGPPHNDAGNTGAGLSNLHDQLIDIGQRFVEAGQQVQQDLQTLQVAETQLQTLNLLLQEVLRLNQMQRPQQTQQQQPQQPQQPQGHQEFQPSPSLSQAPLNGSAASSSRPAPVPPQPYPQPPHFYPAFSPYAAQFFPFPQMYPFPPFTPRQPPTTVTRHGPSPYATAIPAGSPDLPEGVVIPPGWSLLPLQRLDAGTGVSGTPVNVHQPHAQTNPSQRPDSSSNPYQNAQARPNTPSGTAPHAQEGRGFESLGGNLNATRPAQHISTGLTASQSSTGQSLAPSQANSPTLVAPSWVGAAQVPNDGAIATGLPNSQPNQSPRPSPQVDMGVETAVTADGREVHRLGGDRHDVDSSAGAPGGHRTAGEGTNAISSRRKPRSVTVEDDDDSQ